MKVTFIGTGSIMPNPKVEGKPYRSCSAIYVEVGQDKLLFDIGPGTLTKLQQIGVDTRINPTHLFISHYHMDHCQDYIGLAMSRCFDRATGRVAKGEDLKVYGPVDLKEWSDDLFVRTKRWKYMADMLKVYDTVSLKELPDQFEGVVEENQDWKVTAIPVKHYDGVAFRLESEGKSFVYSGDMGYDENISKIGKDSDYVAIECSFPNRASLNGPLHLCPEDIAQLAKLGNFKNTILTHMYPQCEGKEDEMKKVIEGSSNTKVTIAEDFTTIEV